jgi:hypothetical protein
MADEAFALSPISARAAQPSEADYDAIRDAFMETSRGRWFLGEYAKRNRNADTRMVLDAVARIEEALAAQRQPPPDDKLPEALEAIRGAVDQAAAAASAALAGLPLEDNLAPVRKGARIIKEISWRWREIGADSRICDLIDSQVSAIEASCGVISEIDPRPDVSAAFDLIRDKIDGIGDDGDQDAVSENAAAPVTAKDVAVTAPGVTAESQTPEFAEQAPAQEASVAMVVMPDAATINVDLAATEPEAEAIEPDLIAPDLPIEAAVSAIDIADEANEAKETADSAEIDDAILDMVAVEMAAPDETADSDYFSAIDDGEVEIHAPALAEAAAVQAPPPVEIRELALAPQQPRPIQRTLQGAPTPDPAVQPSLGSTLLANGFLEPQRAPINDPLAPIRRMTQAERIAFFS